MIEDRGYLVPIPTVCQEPNTSLQPRFPATGIEPAPFGEEQPQIVQDTFGPLLPTRPPLDAFHSVVCVCYSKDTRMQPCIAEPVTEAQHSLELN